MYKTEIVEVTPIMAKQMLENNYKNNRKINMRTVEQYANDMIEGKWRMEVCGPIALTENGTLMDGQHRLKAVIKANKACLMEIRRGVSYDSYPWFDCGKARTVTDMINTPQRSKVKTLARIMYCLAYGSASLTYTLRGRLIMAQDRKIRNATMVDYINENQDLILCYVQDGGRMRNALYTGTYTHFSAFIALAEYLGCKKVSEFVEKFVSDSPDSVTVVRCKKNLQKMYNNRATSVKIEAGVKVLLYAYDMYENGIEKKIFNDIELVYAKYENMLMEKRNEAD